MVNTVNENYERDEKIAVLLKVAESNNKTIAGIQDNFSHMLEIIKLGDETNDLKRKTLKYNMISLFCANLSITLILFSWLLHIISVGHK